MINLGFDLTTGVPLTSEQNLNSGLKFLNNKTNYSENITVKE